MKPPQEYTAFVQRLWRTRRRLGLSRAALAARLRVAAITIASWELGYRTPTEANARRWAAALHTQLPADTTGWFNRTEIAKEAAHGTRKGYQWHQRHNELPACRPCIDAVNAYMTNRRRRRT